jgi:MFS superfamily sulfate permease-like transporter
VLIFTGYKLCEPRIWRHMSCIGREQLLVFGATVLATLCTDLLWGIGIGMVVKLLVNAWFGHTVTRQRSATNGSSDTRRLPNVRRVLEQFHNPVSRRELIGTEYHVYFDKSLVCFNNLQVNNELKRIPPEAKNIYLHLTEVVSLVDHTSCEHLLHFAEECEINGKGHVEILGMDSMWKRSEFPSCMRLANVIGVDVDLDEAVIAATDADSGRFQTTAAHAGPSAQTHPESSQVAQSGSAGHQDESVQLAALSEMSLSPDGSDAHDLDSEYCRLAMLRKNAHDDKLPLDLFHPNGCLTPDRGG